MGSRHRQRTLSREECLGLLGSCRLGRMVLSVDCLPVARPVFVDIVDDQVVAAVNSSVELEAGQRGDVVAIEVDGHDDDLATWMVSVTGVASLVDPASPLRRRLHGTRLGRAAETGASLVMVPIAVLAGERTWFTT